jgi:putative sigma-54 modulation protein
MRIDISGHQMEVTPALRDYAKEKLGRMAKHFEQHLDTRMILSVDKLEHKAEATIHTPGRTLYADALATDMYAAIDMLADKLDRLVIKQKEKFKNHHRGESAARSDSFG